MISRFLKATYYYLDLNGQDGRPANAKVLYALGFFGGMTTVFAFGIYSIAKRQGISLSLVLLALGVMAMAAGHDVFKTFLKGRATASLAQAAGREAAESIRKRRELGREDGIEYTE